MFGFRYLCTIPKHRTTYVVRVLLNNSIIIVIYALKEEGINDIMEQITN